MASTDTKKSSRFSTFKVFGFTSSKPPPPPPKDAHYLYASSSRNPSVASFSNQSVLSPDSDPQPSACKSIRSPSPAPSRMLQPQFQPEQHRSQQSPPPSILTLSRTLDSSPSSSKKGFFRKVSSFRKRSASKSSRVTNVDDATDDESISLPWNVQHHIHIDEAFQGVPPEWSSTLADLGYSEAEIALIQKGRRNRSPMQEQQPSSTAPSRSQSPTSTTFVNPRARSSSLRRQKSDASISRSERSLRIGPPAPPPPLPLPPPPQTPSAGPSSAIPAAPPPTPASAGAISETTDQEGDTAQSDAQYTHLHPHHPTPIQPVPVPAPVPALVPVAQPTPVHVLQRSPSSSGTRSPIAPPLRTGSSDRERRFRAQTPPRRQFRVVNTTPPRGEESPQPLYLEDAARSGSPLPIMPVTVIQPRPGEKEDTAFLRRMSESETPPSDPPSTEEEPRSTSEMQSTEEVGQDAKEEEEGKGPCSGRQWHQQPRFWLTCVCELPTRLGTVGIARRVVNSP
ncbi:hypothetical protein EDB87DRAFT_1407777 [Lactarius vividus]|nr:hypothetical protein EDB87DRAFT_1407777 [Lactarius vividus]